MAGGKGYDPYAAANMLEERLTAEGQRVWADQVAEVIRAGSTGTEIFMGLRSVLRALSKGGQSHLSAETDAWS
jgi:hypothetical protein